jgi:hypothetical protein
MLFAVPSLARVELFDDGRGTRKSELIGWITVEIVGIITC